MRRPNRPFLIAVTGGIASGKSLFCKELEKQEFDVHYSDEIAHKVLAKTKIKKIISEKFKHPALSDEGEIDRKLLSDLVFNDPEKLKFLNAVIHPEVKLEMQKIIDSSISDVLIFEIPLLLEAGLEKAFDLTINLHSERSIQISRLEQNRKLTKQKAEKIIKAQIDPNIREAGTDLTIYNNGDLFELRQAVKELLKQLPELPFKKIKKITES